MTSEKNEDACAIVELLHKAGADLCTSDACRFMATQVPARVMPHVHHVPSGITRPSLTAVCLLRVMLQWATRRSISARSRAWSV